MEHLNSAIEHFGYLGIILVLVGGIIGLPIPDEVLLTYVGYNVFQDRLSLFPSVLSAFIGAAGGISLSYYIGFKFGLPLIKKHGSKFHISEEKVNRTQRLFQQVGPTLLLIGYFIPGVRHLAAFVSALNQYPFRKFVVYAYSGALIWVITFITLGIKLGKKWNLVEFYVSKSSFYVILISLLVFACIVNFWKQKTKKEY
ncbi:DedA family protein [Peribacillus sp. SCS-37]|uniref:DedA family protein n=1 Tax=Paraperibacillus esterisolvens TaxID=3115296 RepID=UPI003905E6D6